MSGRPTTREIRIIAGSLRGSKIAVIDAPGLRPTPDRVRETLFNWLAPTITNSRVLDCFAGTGALGIEALSRGAKEVVFVDNHAPAIQHIQANCLRLKVADRSLYHAVALPQALVRLTGVFDLVFVDPPFAAEQWQSTLSQLQAQQLINAATQIYLEFPDTAQVMIAQLPLRCLKRSRAGSVYFGLFTLS
jgi:16S rRNA (guanine966-N2)-methyltransferase